jgi:hypothetical protein
MKTKLKEICMLGGREAPPPSWVCAIGEMKAVVRLRICVLRETGAVVSLDLHAWEEGHRR